MSLIVNRAIGAQNDEPQLAAFFKKYSNRDLENVRKINKNKLEFTFSEKGFKGKQRIRVVQVKKEKYNCKEEVKKFFENETTNNHYLEIKLWQTVWVIELPNKWLVFCKR